jgi:hypothetical protein
MAEDIRQLLTTDEVVDITTTGRKSGDARRIEIRLHALDGKLYITGRPGRLRSWYANMVAKSAFTLHLKQDLKRDVQCNAVPITEDGARRKAFELMLLQEASMAHVDVAEWAKVAPLVEVVPTD